MNNVVGEDQYNQTNQYNQVGQNNENVPAIAKQVEGGQFFVRTLTGSSLAFSHSPNTTIIDLKRSIFEAQQIPVDQQRLVFQGKQLEDGNTLGDYGIGPDASIHLVLRLRGGF